MSRKSAADLAMDFFQRQDTARRYTRWLLIYYPIALVLIVGSVYLVVALVVSKEIVWDRELFAGTATLTVLLIAAATVTKIAQLRGGGGAVAAMLGGVPVDPNTRDGDERKLLNIVEEMAIASGTPVPEVWVLPRESGINAFAAGHDINDAVVAVTDGAIRLLSRDELQGVIAHEFSHILNADVRLNVRILGLLHGILVLALIGRAFMRTRGRKNPLPVIGLGLSIIGSTGFFFGSVIRSAVSRQREYLADASAVQFTRNPLGLADALKKIGGCSAGSVMTAAGAEEASHFFFANGVSGFLSGLMSTHPPLDERIRLLDPAFDGKYPVVNVDRSRRREEADTIRPAVPYAQLASKMRADAVLNHVGAPAAEHLDYASSFRQNLSPALNKAAHEPLEAMRLVFALLLSPHAQIRTMQWSQLQQHAEPTRRLAVVVDSLPVTFRLPLVSLALPALKRLSEAQYQDFAAHMDMLVACDKQIDLFEYTLKAVVSRNLRPPPVNPIQIYSLRPLLPECAVLISALARLGGGNFAAAKTAFERGMEMLSPEARGYTLLNLNECGVGQIDAVLARLGQASPTIKKRVLHACAHAVACDGIIQSDEAELLRVIAETLDCPIPPFIRGV